MLRYRRRLSSAVRLRLWSREAGHDITERISEYHQFALECGEAEVFDYIECFYNQKRRHSTIGYPSMVEFEKRKLRMLSTEPGAGQRRQLPRSFIRTRTRCCFR
jgi:transposase InsO family protein